MEELKRILREANKSLKTADHLVYVTYPLVKDHKILISVMENLNTAVTKAMDSVLYYDRMFKRIDSVPDAFNLRFEVFKAKCMPRHNIDREFVEFILDLKNVINTRKESAIDFTRKDRFYICSDDYRMQAITFDKIKGYLIQTKSFLNKINSLFEKKC